MSIGVGIWDLTSCTSPKGYYLYEKLFDAVLKEVGGMGPA